MSVFPKKDSYYELRFHSIGGQGAYTVGQMIAELVAEIPALKSSVFASYGSEKKGAPVNVFVRMLESEKKITNYSAVKNPNVVVVFHEKLLKTIDVLTGLKDEGFLIVNSELSPEELAQEYKLNVGKIYTIDALKYARESESKLNTVMYGSLMNIFTFLDYEKGIQKITQKLAYKYPELVQKNEKAYELGYKNLIKAENIVNTSQAKDFANIDLGYENQYEGGIILGPNAHKVDRSISREGFVPTFDQEICINCTKCDLTCPDDCFIWEEVEGRRGRQEMILTGINYQHCKGCLRCVDVCPTGALLEKIETRDFFKEKEM